MTSIPTIKPPRFFLFGILAMVGLVVLPVVAPLGLGVVAFAIGLITGVVSLAAVSLGLIVFGVASIPYLNLWLELRDIDQRGIEKTGWKVLPFENKTTHQVQESSWKRKVEFKIDEETDLSSQALSFFENIVDPNISKRVGFKTMMYAKQQGIQEQKGFLSLEKDWLWFQYRLPIHVDWVRKELH
jgi:membrane protein implicated in regulation of membrane protease activity